MAAQTRLSYSSNPGTVAAAGQTSLTVVVVNNGSGPVKVEQITLSIPQGSAATDLIASNSTIITGGTYCSNGSQWVLSVSGSDVLVLPVSQTGHVVLAKGDTVYLCLAALQMNGVGAGESAAVAVTEYAEGSLARTGSISLQKSTTTMQVEKFAPNAYSGNFGATVTLDWNVTNAVSCALQAQTLQNYGSVSGAVAPCQGSGPGGSGPSGSYQCALQGPTLFTLTATAAGSTVTETILVASGLPAPKPYVAPRVLIPINVTAMVMTNHIQTTKTFSAAVPNYWSLKHYQPAVPQPFAPGLPSVGVTLHWVLPSALKHGRVESATGELIFPVVPNRWLITRFAPDPSAASGRSVTAWLVQSDYLGNDGSNSFAPPTVRQLLPTMIGTQAALGEWNGEQAGYPLFLSALGDGQASFVAYTAGINNVFAFQDGLSDVTSNGRLSYVVTGWYSDPAQDALAPGATTPEWEQLMKQFGWTVTQPATPVYPPQLACQGMIYDVFWAGPDYPSLCTNDRLPVQPISGVPVTAQTKSSACPGQALTAVDIAIGNTPLDAFASLVEYQLGNSPSPPDYDVRALLQAFFYDELIDYGTSTGEVRLDEKVRQTWYGSTPGGTAWNLVPKENPDPSSSPPRPKPELEPEAEPGLVDVNQKQRLLDQAEGLLAALQQELYQLWWKQQKAASRFTVPAIPAAIKATVDATYAKVKAQVEKLLADVATEGSIAYLRMQRDLAKKKITDEIVGEGGPFDLVAVSTPSTWHPNAPVLLITGAMGSYKHGPDGRLSSDGTLACRLTGQTLDALSVSYDANANTVTLAAGAAASCTGSACAVVAYADLQLTFDNQDLNAAYLAHQVPPESAALVLEAFLLDTGNAATLLGIALKKMGQTPSDLPALVQQFQQQQLQFVSTGAMFDRLSLAPAASGTGFVPPSAIAVSPWQAAWSPLYMDWQVTWYPAATVANGRLSQWEFDPDAGNGLHYKWKGGNLASGGIELQGRAILSGSSTDLLGKWLNQRLKQDPQINNPDLFDLAKRIQTWDVLAQSLSGFTEQLVQLEIGQHPLPTKDLNLIGSGDAAIPNPGTVGDAPPFCPLRAGQLVLTELWVVDDFGQVFDPIQASDAMPMIAGPALALDSNGNLLPPASQSQSVTRAAFPPRIAQESRLNFRFISAQENAADAKDISIDPVLSPVCGYLLRNLLDNSLAVYGDDGGLEGSLYLSGNGIVQWEPNPAFSSTVGQPPEIANQYLLSVVKGILVQANNATAFQALLDELDLIVTKLDLSGASYNNSLTALIGRPIAVVRARLQFEYAGLPYYNQAWEQTGNFDTAGIENVKLAVRLGGLKMPHDGIYGYFVDSATSATQGYDRFHVVYEDPKLLANKSPYITSENIELSFGDKSPTHVTMLMEPSSSAYAITGVYPDHVIALAGDLTNPAIQNMDIVFRTGPTLSPSDQVSLIKPSAIYGDWDWVEHAGVKIATLPVTQTEIKATFASDPPYLRDGWLKLSNALGSHDNPVGQEERAEK